METELDLKNNVTLLKFTNRKSDRVCTQALQEKWKLFFRFLDINKDGVINARDFIAVSNNVSRLYIGSPKSIQQIANLTTAMTSWWNFFKLHFGDTREVSTESEFVTALKCLFETNITALESQAENMSNSFFDLLDLDCDGLVSRQEYVKLFSAMGVTNDCYVGRVFDRLDSNKSGVLERGGVQKAFTDFFLSDYPQNSMAFLFEFPPS